MKAVCIIHTTRTTNATYVLADGKNQEAFQYFKETAAAISLVAENGINILSMQYDKIQQVSEDTVLASYLAPQKDVKMPQMPEAVIYPFGLNQSQKLVLHRLIPSVPLASLIEIFLLLHRHRHYMQQS